ncbi:TonB-dependent receptor [bacterium]|nr:TonB-dependent receptor [bacterium]
MTVTRIVHMIILVVGLVALLPGPILSQEQKGSNEVEQVMDLELFLDEDMYVVTSSKMKQKITESPSAVTVISKEDIERIGATNIIDILRMVPGVEVYIKTYSDMDVGIRGFNYDENPKVMVLLDGHRINTPFHSGMQWAQVPITLEDIEKIEVVRGPASAMYGADAFSGVINIITVPLEERRTWTKAGIGEDGYYHAESSTNYRQDRLTMNLNMAMLNPEYPGQKESDDNELLTNWETKDVAEQIRLIGEGMYAFESGALAKLGVHWAETKGGYNSDPSGTNLVNATWKQYIVHASYAHPLENGAQFELRYSGYKTDQYNRFIEEGSVMDGYEGAYTSNWVYNSFAQDHMVDLEYAATIAGKHRVIGAYTFKYSDQEATFYIPSGSETYDESLHALSIQDEFELSSKYLMTFSARYDNYTTVGGHFTPRCGLVYMPKEDMSFRLSAGQAYRKPNIVELYYYVDINEGQYFTGDEDLKPELLTSYELGYRQLFQGKYNVSLDLFYQQAKDIVGYSEGYDPELGKDYLAFANVMSLSGYGAELALDARLNTNLSAFANYSYQQFTDDDTDEDIKTAPQNKFNLGVRYLTRDKWSFDLRFHHVSETEDWVAPITTKLDAYSVINASIQKDLFNDNLRIAVSVYNLTDSGHYEYPDYTEMHRKLVLSFRYLL